MVCYRVYCPSGADYESALRGALAPLAVSYNWEAVGTVTPEDAAQAFVDANAETMKWRRCLYAGTVLWFATANLPDGVLACDGGLYARLEYAALFDAIGTVFGTTSSSNFAVPNLQRRFAVGVGSPSSGYTFALGDIGGDLQVTLTEAQLAAHDHVTPDHSHSVQRHSHSVHTHLAGLAVAPGELPVSTPGAVPGFTGDFSPTTSTSGGDDTTATGNDEPHDNMPPYIALYPGIVAR
jgi:microcystin-dependent protein